MRVSVETMSGLERRVTVGVPADRVDSACQKRLKEAASNVRLPGFRPGKVPMRVMQQRLAQGSDKRYWARSSANPSKKPLCLKTLRPAGQPSIEARKMGAGQDVEYTATFEIFPSIEVKEIADLVIEKPTARSPMLMSITSLRYSEAAGRAGRR